MNEKVFQAMREAGKSVSTNNVAKLLNDNCKETRVVKLFY